MKRSGYLKRCPVDGCSGRKPRLYPGRAGQGREQDGWQVAREGVGTQSGSWMPVQQLLAAFFADETRTSGTQAAGRADEWGMR